MRNNHVRNILLFACFFSAGVICPQEIADTLLYPFASRIRVAVLDPYVRIQWQDSTDPRAHKYLIYRHTRVIDETSIEDAELLAAIETGVEDFRDIPTQPGRYYYAVIIESQDKQTFQILIPFRNTTLRSVVIRNTATEEELAARITNINAIATESEIILSFDILSFKNRQLSLYRSTQPFSKIKTLANFPVLDTIYSTQEISPIDISITQYGSYVDDPSPEIEYYYAVLDTRLVEKNLHSIHIGFNATETPIQIKTSEQTEKLRAVASAVMRTSQTILNAKPIRKKPLPLLDYKIHTTLLAELPKTTKQILQPATKHALAGLLENTEPLHVFSPIYIILPQERQTQGRGAPRRLAQTVNSTLAIGDYESGIKELQYLLTSSLNIEFEYRVRFYLGQMLYFLGDKEASFMEFLRASQGELAYIIEPWIDGLLLPEG